MWICDNDIQVICLRRSVPRGTATAATVSPKARITLSDMADADGAVSGFFDLFLGPRQAIEFTSGWEVLMHQSETINWLRSEPGKLRTLRYAGEWKLFGGIVDQVA